MITALFEIRSVPSLQLLWCLPAVSRHVSHISDPGRADVPFAVGAFDLWPISRVLPVVMVLQIAEIFVIHLAYGTFEHQLTPLVGYSAVLGQQLNLYHPMRFVGMRSAGFFGEILLRTELAFLWMGC